MTAPNSPGERPLKVAVLSDIHGNLQALDAALDELLGQDIDALVSCGDIAAGPFPAETIDRLMGLDLPAYFVRGNADRELVAAFDNHTPFDPAEKNPARFLAGWCTPRIDQQQRDFLSTFQDRLVLNIAGLGPTLFCHGAPRSDTELITMFTPESALDSSFAGVDERVIVCGHTHHQFDLQLTRYRVINPGSLGMPYEGAPGAYWALLGPGVELRRTEYDVAQAVADAQAVGFPLPEYAETMLTPPPAETVAAHYEQVAAARGQRG